MDRRAFLKILAAAIAAVGILPAMSSELLATPVGTLAYLHSPVLEPGWLWANGGAVSREAYAGLFAVIGTDYGAGDGKTTFNLPGAPDVGGREVALAMLGLDTGITDPRPFVRRAIYAGLRGPTRSI